MVRGSNRSSGKRFFLSSKTCSLPYKGYSITFPGYSGRGVKLTTHLHRVSRLRMSGVDRYCFYTLHGVYCFIPLFTSTVFGWDCWSLKMLSLGNSIIQKRGNKKLYWSSNRGELLPSVIRCKKFTRPCLLFYEIR